MKTTHAFLQFVVGSYHFTALFVETFSGFGQTHLASPAHALKQSLSKLLFKAAHLLADSRLRYEIALRRLREALRFDQIAKYFQRLNLHRGFITAATPGQRM